MKPSDGYVAYIVNPKSGADAAKKIADQFAEYLLANGFDVHKSFSKSMSDVCELSAKAAMDDECGIVVVSGGDGTVREAANGLEGSGKPLMIIPSGTENLLANELGLEGQIDWLITVFEEGNERMLDLGSANGRCFTSVMGFGFDGDIVKRVSDKRKGHIRHLDYLQPILQSFREYSFPVLKVVADGEEIFNEAGLLFVGNISRYAMGLQILHKADFGDGLLDVCIYKCASRLRLIKHTALTILKLHANAEDVIYRQCKSVYVSSPSKDVRTEIDGDPGPSLPMQVEVIPQAVKVIVPKGGKRVGIRTKIKKILK
jgi:YegS/Rv2252/BmrU family lipid kinase